MSTKILRKYIEKKSRCNATSLYTPKHFRGKPLSIWRRGNEIRRAIRAADLMLKFAILLACQCPLLG